MSDTAAKTPTKKVELPKIKGRASEVLAAEPKASLRQLAADNTNKKTFKNISGVLDRFVSYSRTPVDRTTDITIQSVQAETAEALETTPLILNLSTKHIDEQNKLLEDILKVIKDKEKSSDESKGGGSILDGLLDALDGAGKKGKTQRKYSGEREKKARQRLGQMRRQRMIRKLTRPFQGSTGTAVKPPATSVAKPPVTPTRPTVPEVAKPPVTPTRPTVPEVAKPPVSPAPEVAKPPVSPAPEVAKPPVSPAPAADTTRVTAPSKITSTVSSATAGSGKGAAIAAAISGGTEAAINVATGQPAGQGVATAVGKSAAIAASATIADNVIRDTVYKVGSQKLKKSWLRNIPVIGTGLGLTAAASRAFSGDWVGASLETTSAALNVAQTVGAATAVTGVGAAGAVAASAANIAIQTALIAKDVYDAVYQASYGVPPYLDKSEEAPKREKELKEKIATYIEIFIKDLEEEEIEKRKELEKQNKQLTTSTVNGNIIFKQDYEEGNFTFKKGEVYDQDLVKEKLRVSDKDWNDLTSPSGWKYLKDNGVIEFTSKPVKTESSKDEILKTLNTPSSDATKVETPPPASPVAPAPVAPAPQVPAPVAPAPVAPAPVAPASSASPVASVDYTKREGTIAENRSELEKLKVTYGAPKTRPNKDFLLRGMPDFDEKYYEDTEVQKKFQELNKKVSDDVSANSKILSQTKESLLDIKKHEPKDNRAISRELADASNRQEEKQKAVELLKTRYGYTEDQLKNHGGSVLKLFEDEVKKELTKPTQVQQTDAPKRPLSDAFRERYQQQETNPPPERQRRSSLTDGSYQVASAQTTMTDAMPVASEPEVKVSNKKENTPDNIKVSNQKEMNDLEKLLTGTNNKNSLDASTPQDTTTTSKVQQDIKKNTSDEAEELRILLETAISNRKDQETTKRAEVIKQLIDKGEYKKASDAIIKLSNTVDIKDSKPISTDIFGENPASKPAKFVSAEPIVKLTSDVKDTGEKIVDSTKNTTKIINQTINDINDRQLDIASNSVQNLTTEVKEQNKLYETLNDAMSLLGFKKGVTKQSETTTQNTATSGAIQPSPVSQNTQQTQVAQPPVSSKFSSAFSRMSSLASTFMGATATAETPSSGGANRITGGAISSMGSMGGTAVMGAMMQPQSSGGSTASTATIASPVAGPAATNSPPSGADQSKSGAQPSGDFMTEVGKVASNLGIDTSNLIAIMKSESSLNPQAVNPVTGASGLIQFMPNTAKSLGTTVEELRKMTAVQQLPYVEKYFKSVRVQPGSSAGRLYAYVFLPGRANREVLTQAGENYYESNKGLDIDRDGKITIADLDARLAKYGGSAGASLQASRPSTGASLSAGGTSMEASDQAQMRGAGQALQGTTAPAPSTGPQGMQMPAGVMGMGEIPINIRLRQLQS